MKSSSEAKGCCLLYVFHFLYLENITMCLSVCAFTHKPPHLGRTNKNSLIKGHMSQFQGSWTEVFRECLFFENNSKVCLNLSPAR